jgi:type I restriction enzyme M protein
VEQEDTREVIDIKKLNAKIAEIVKREDELRKAIDEIVNDLEMNINNNDDKKI